MLSLTKNGQLIPITQMSNTRNRIMPNYKAQSFSHIIKKHNLKKVFGDNKNEEVIKETSKCINCNKEIYWRNCECETPRFNEHGVCMRYIQNKGQDCEGKINTCQCESPRQKESKFISLYESHQCYGGAEEGGWWYHQSFLQESYECIDEQQASEIRQEMWDFADEMNELSKKQHNKHLAESLEWLEARNLDADFLPEPDGPSEYHVTYERYPGESDTGNYRPHYC